MKINYRLENALLERLDEVTGFSSGSCSDDSLWLHFVNHPALKDQDNYDVLMMWIRERNRNQYHL